MSSRPALLDSFVPWRDDRELDTAYQLRKQEREAARQARVFAKASRRRPAKQPTRPPRPRRLKVTRVVHVTRWAVLVETAQLRLWLPKRTIIQPAAHLVLPGWSGILKARAP